MRLFVDVTDHGFGHLSQTAPILEAMRREWPDIQFVVRTGLDPALVRDRLGADITTLPSTTDFGCVMASPFEVDRQATFERYRAVQDQFDGIVDEIAQAMTASRCTGVFANISYPALAAAQRAGIPSVACSSLIWSEVADHYIGDIPGAASVVQAIGAAYDAADLILRLEPGMAMSRHQTTAIERPIARVGLNRARELRQALGLPDKALTVLCAFGGMLPEKPVQLMSNDALAIIGPTAWGPGIIPVDFFNWPFEDLMASVDTVVTKPGYGIIAELGCSGVPAILISRGDWPDEPDLMKWLKRVGRCVLLPTFDTLDSAALIHEVRLLLALPPRDPIANGGENDVAKACLALLV